MSFSGSKILVLLGSILLIRIALFDYSQTGNISNLSDSVRVAGIIDSPVVNNSRFQRFILENIEITTSAYPPYAIGERIEVKGVVEKRSGRLTMYYPQITASETGLPKIGIYSSFMVSLQQFRQSITMVLRRVYGEPDASLAAGILLGDKAGLSKEFSTQLRNLGLSHVVVASGANVTLVAAFFSVLLVLFVGARWGGIFSIPLIWLYTAIAGFDPSIIRAAIMASFSFGAKSLGREHSGWLGLGLAGYLMILFDPLVVTKISFQLSFASMAGIIALSDLDCHSWIKSIKKVPVLGETLAQTFFAQAATFPLICAYFGQFNLLSPVVNGLVLWTVPVIMLISAAAGIAGLFSAGLGALISIPGGLLLRYFILIVEVFSKENLGLLVFRRVDGTMILGILLIIVGGYWAMRRAATTKNEK